MKEKSSEKLNPTAASILGFLQRGPLTGYEISQLADGSIGYFWNVTRSQIYRELATLAKDGFVKTGKSGVRDKTPYALTDAGRAAIVEWLNKEPAVEVIRFPLLLSLFFGEEIEPEKRERFLSAHRLRHEKILEEYLEIRRASGSSMSAFQKATLDFGIDYEQMVLGWFDKLKLPSKGKKS